MFLALVVFGFVLGEFGELIAGQSSRLTYEQAYYRKFQHYPFNRNPFTPPPRNEPEPAIAPSRIHPDVRPPSYRRSFSRARGYPEGYASSGRHHPGYSYGERLIHKAQPWEDRNQVDSLNPEAAAHVGTAARIGARRTSTGFQGGANPRFVQAHGFDHDIVRSGPVGIFGKARGFPF